MAKFKRKKKSQAEIDAIEADRVAAHEEQAGEAIKEALASEPVERDFAQEAAEMAVAETEQREASEAAEKAALAEVEEEAKLPNSVVAEKFKLKYIENAKANGIAGKAAKRSNWDWLAQEIAAECLKEKEKIDIQEFMDLLELNGVDYSRWTNRNKGWEGRFRMTGRVALQKVVANAGRLKKKMSESIPPEAWVAKFKTKE